MNINGHEIRPEQLEAALTQVVGSAPAEGFTIRALQQSLEALSVPGSVSYLAAKRFLQKAKLAGRVEYNPVTKTWVSLEVQSPTATAPIQTGQIIPPAAPVPVATDDVEEPSEGSRILIHIIGLATSDLMRPLLIAQGIYWLAKARLPMAAAAFTVALVLMPLSLLSSTSVLSAKLFLGLEENQRVETKLETKKRLQQEYDRLSAKLQQTLKFWEDECDRGGCGPIAADIKAEAEQLDVEAKGVLSRVVKLDDETSGATSCTARNVKAFESMGLYGGERSYYIPLGIALTMEIAAVFGAGLLLSGLRQARRSRRQRDQVNG